MNRILAFGIAALAHTTISVFAGDEPMQVESVSDPVELLITGETDEQWDAERRILKERRELVEALCQVVRDRGKHDTSSLAAAHAIRILGEFRAPEAIDALVDAIAFPLIVKRGERPRLPDGLPRDIATRHHAVMALLLIGEPSVDKLLWKLATSEEPLEVQLCQETLVRINKRHERLHEQVQTALRQAIAANKEGDHQNVQAVADLLSRITRQDAGQQP
jgi:hypothetical protein